MKIIITEKQFDYLSKINEQIDPFNFEPFKNPKRGDMLSKDIQKKLLNCGYKTWGGYEKNNWKCPSKVLINAKKCGWSDIFRYEASGWKCTPGKKGFLSVAQVQKVNAEKLKYGFETGFEKYDLPTQLKIQQQDRPDLIYNKYKKYLDYFTLNYCKPFCVSKEISCFIGFVRANRNKIMSKLGNGITDQELLMLVKIAMGVMAWQSNYGTLDRLYDIETSSFGPLEVNAYDIYKHGKLGQKAIEKYSKKKGKKKGKEPSFGPAEIKPSTFKKYKIEDLFGKTIESVTGAGLGVMFNTWNLYVMAKNMGLSDGPSRNEIVKQLGTWTNGVNGTGNHIWDVAIASHTWPKEKMIVKYCKTEDPLFAAPCNSPTYIPFKTEGAWKEWMNGNSKIKEYYNRTRKPFPGVIKVLQSQPLLDYYPYLSGYHGSGGVEGIDSKTIMEFVSKKIKSYNCVKIGGMTGVVDSSITKPKTIPRGGIASA